MSKLVFMGFGKRVSIKQLGYQALKVSTHHVVKDKVVGTATQSVTFVDADDELVLLGQSLELDAWVSSWYCPGKQAKQDVASYRLRASRPLPKISPP